MSSFTDYYALLEIAPTSSFEQIKGAYRRLALLHHPDKNEGSELATCKTQLLNEAWEALKDENRREVYDSKYMKNKPSRPSYPRAEAWDSQRHWNPRPSTASSFDSGRWHEKMAAQKEFERKIRLDITKLKDAIQFQEDKISLAKHILNDPNSKNISKDVIQQEIRLAGATVRLKRAELGLERDRLTELEAERKKLEQDRAKAHEDEMKRRAARYAEAKQRANKEAESRRRARYYGKQEH